MSGEILSVSTNRTSLGILDQTRPQAMTDADKIFKMIMGKTGNSNSGALAIVSVVVQQLGATNAGNLDQLWGSLEKALTQGSPIKTTAKTAVGKLNTALGLIYSALNKLDTGTSARNITSLQNLYSQAKKKVSVGIISSQKPADQNVIGRVFKSIEMRFNEVGTRFNTLVTNGQASGPKIQVMPDPTRTTTTG